MNILPISYDEIEAGGNDDYAKSITLAAKDAVYVYVSWAPDDNERTLDSVKWGSTPLTQVGSKISTDSRTVLYKLDGDTVAGTHDITLTFSEYVSFGGHIIVARDSDGGAIVTSALLTDLYFDGGTWHNPSTTIVGVPAGALVIDSLTATIKDIGYGAAPAVWSSTSPATSFGADYENTANWRVQWIKAQYTVGVDADVTTGWTPSANQPRYTHISFVLSTDEPTPRINLPIFDAAGTPIADMSGVTATARALDTSATVLATTNTAIVSSGKLIFADTDLGEINDIVFVTYSKVDAADPTNYLKTLSGGYFAKVVSSSTSDLS